MIIKSAEFKGCYADFKQLPNENLPEIALVGRSNVGKSSLINKVVNRKNLAKSSSTPGKTRTINYYLLNQAWNMVDLPGYGYAKVSKSEQQKWGRFIEKYLAERTQLKGVIQLLDIRHEPTDNDRLMQEWLLHNEIPILIVATKADKISRGARSKHLAAIRRVLQLPADQSLICFSAENGEGVEEVLNAIEELLKD
ncbi:ribosome biogenesis GTP-binding protein YihA/YsxC [Syntrophomonas palmitatica]|uniref:ribosome biogenesis GTP-binding protein YihA/YsxC n=1 Tax=Syntrophomonas palmitatica TaxID=402877 RepID=UPI0006D02DCD